MTEKNGLVTRFTTRNLNCDKALEKKKRKLLSDFHSFRDVHDEAIHFSFYLQKVTPMLRSMLQSFKSPSRRRRQVGRSIAVPVQALELKQLLSAVQTIIDAPDQQQDTESEGEPAAAPISETTVTATVAQNSGMFSRQPTVVLYFLNSPFRTVPIVPVLAAQVRVPQQITQAPATIVSPNALSRLATPVTPVSPLTGRSMLPIQPIVAKSAIGPTVTPSVFDDHGNNAATATVVLSPSTTAGQLHQGDSDWFRLGVKKGQTYTISTELLTLSDSTLRIHNAEGTILKFDDNGGAGFASKLTWTASEDSTIYIDVSANSSSQTGTYRLHISNDSNVGDETGQTSSPVTQTATTSVVRTTRVYILRIVRYR